MACMKLRPRWLALLALALLTAGWLGWSALRPTVEPAQTLICHDLQAGCSATLAGRPVRLGMIGEPRVLMPFEVWVQVEDAERVQASFTMEGMDMGFNLYTLRPDAAGVFHSRVTLPVCVSGERDWVMTVDIDGRRIAVPFVTKL